MKLRIKMSPQKADRIIPEYGSFDEYQQVWTNRLMPDVKCSTVTAQSGQCRVDNPNTADVTGRMHAEAELRDSQEHYRAIIEAFDGLIYICSQDYRILFMNEKLIARTGRNAVGEPCFKALHDLETICPWCVSERVFGGETVSWDIRSPKDGHWYYVVNTPIHNADGTISKQAMIQDITGRKLAEEALRMNEAKQRAMIENIVDVIAIIDRDGINRYKSPNIEKWFGWRPEEVIGESVWNNVHPDDLENSRKIFAGLLGEENASVTSECRYQCKDGSYKWIRYTGINLLHNPDLCGVLMSFHDITERKQAEEERQRLEQQFHQAQKLESLGILASGIAHDFNNILTVILGHCYMAREDMLQEHEYMESFEKIESAGKRASDLCRQMLIYAGSSTQRQSRVDMKYLIEEVVKMLRSAINKNVTINLDISPDIPEIMGDSAQLQQVVMNLVINASEAIGNVFGTVRVVLCKSEFLAEQMEMEMDTFRNAALAGSYVCLEVTDTGCGMSEETRTRIFEPFYTTKNSGRGLGMSAISDIVASHKGMLQLTSTPGVGTTFKVFFPVPDACGFDETTNSESAPVEKAGGTILLVEDDQPILNMGTALLKAMGFTVLTAQNGQEALQHHQEHGCGIDLILLDLIMPVMGGLGTYFDLRKKAPAIPIIICSGYGVESVAGIIDNDEYSGFVQKPYNPDQLRDVIIKMIGTSKPYKSTLPPSP